jgi:hypothetical protein
MLKLFYFLLLSTLFSVNCFSQEFSDPSRTEFKDNAGLQGSKSGFFQATQPINYPAGASNWWHLLDVRHTNTANNFAMQFSGSFFDQNLYFRKTNNVASQAWSKVVLEANGKVGINSLIDIDTKTEWENASYVRFAGSTAQPQYYNLTISKVDTRDAGTNHPTFDYNFDHYQYSGINGTQLSLKYNGDVGVGGGLLFQDASGYLTGGSIKPGVDGLVTNGGNIHTIVAGSEVRINAPLLLAKKIKVSTSWADYVFAPGYNLRSLTSVERFINKYKHLPDVPSAQEVEKNDLDLGATQALLLKKVEELTLYMIQQDKLNQQQQKLIKSQQEMLESLKNEIKQRQ